MNRQARVLFNIISSSSGGNLLALQSDSAQHSFYQRLIYSLLARGRYVTEGLESLGRQLADIARHADFTKQTDVVEQASSLMLALPISVHLKSVARHYQALCAKRKGNFDDARRLFERVLKEIQPQYKARALQAIGTIYHEQGDIAAALPFYVAAGEAATELDLLALAGSQQMIAVVRSLHGDHKQALDDLERLFPLAQAIGKHYPAFYYDYLNSLAVELGEVGRITEAQAACAITLASPFAAAYQNWSETRDELKARRTCATPSVVAVSAAIEPALSTQPARKSMPSRAVAICWLARPKICFQRSALLIVGASPATSISIIKITLDRLHHSINPRSPPVRFLL